MLAITINEIMKLNLPSLVLVLCCLSLIYNVGGIDSATPRDQSGITQVAAVTGLNAYYIQQLEPIDFRDVNDIDGDMNCYFCTLAAFRDTSVTKLVDEVERMMEATGAPTLEYIIDLYRDAGFTDATHQDIGGQEQMAGFLDQNIVPGQETAFALAFERHDGSRHVIFARAWKEGNGAGYFLSTDFQLPLGPTRFSTAFPDARYYWIIIPGEWNPVTARSRYLTSRLITGRRGIALNNGRVSKGGDDGANSPQQCNILTRDGALISLVRAMAGKKKK